MKILIILAFVLLASIPVFAIPEDVSAICGVNDTLTFRVDTIRCVNNVCSQIQRNSTVTCPFGCNDRSVPNECNGSPFQVNIAFYAAIIVIILFLIGVYKYLKSR